MSTLCFGVLSHRPLAHWRNWPCHGIVSTVKAIGVNTMFLCLVLQEEVAMAQNGINSSSLVEAAGVNIVPVLSRRSSVH